MKVAKLEKIKPMEVNQHQFGGHSIKKRPISNPLKIPTIESNGGSRGLPPRDDIIKNLHLIRSLVA